MERFFRRPKLIVAVIGIITMFFALQLPRARLDNNNFRFLPADDAELRRMNRFDERFGSQVMLLVGLERSYGTVLEADFLNRIRGFGDRIRDLDLVKSVTSIVSTPHISGSGDAITVEPLVPEGFSGTRAETEALKRRINGWDLYRRSIISDDYASTQIVVTIDISPTDAGKPEVIAAYRAIKRLAAEAEFPGTSFYITGSPVFSAVVNEATARDLVFLVPLVVVVVLLTLFLSFRRMSGIVLPLLTVLVSAIWSIGAMPLLGVQLTMITTILPVILVAVGSAYGIHVVSHYFDELAGAEEMDETLHRELIFSLLRKVGRPVFLAALTTLAGFASFCFTPVVPIFEFGIFASIGVAVAWLVSVTLIPAILLIRGPVRKLPRYRIAEIQPGREDPLSAAIATGLRSIVERKRSTLFVTAIAVFVSLIGVSRIVIDNVMVEYFKPDTDVVRSDGFIRRHFGGSKEVSLVVSSDVPGEVLRPDVLDAMDGLARYLAANVPEVGKTTGITDLLKRINQIFNVDEAPDRVRAAAAPAAPAAATREPAIGTETEPAFGFGFGSGTGDAAAIAPAQTAAAAEPSAPVRAPRAMDDRNLAELLENALSGGDRADMNARELVRAIHRASNYEGAAYYEIPADPARYGKADRDGLKSLIANYLFLLGGETSGFADDPFEPKAVRMSIQLRTIGQIDTMRAIGKIKGYAAANFPKDVTVEIGGSALVEGSLNDMVVNSQLVSLAVSLAMVFGILAVYYRSPLAGLVGLAPLAVSILANFAIMGFAGIKLNIGTALVASIAIGIGIDYTIHYLAAYHHEWLATGGTGDFLRRTFLTSGKAIIFNAATVGCGFAVLALSRFNILAQLGGLITVTMATSSLVSLTLLPVLLELLRPAFIRKPLPSDRIGRSRKTARPEVSR